MGIVATVIYWIITVVGMIVCLGKLSPELAAYPRPER